MTTTPWGVPAAKLVLSLAEAQDDPQLWHDVRNTGYTGTDAATLLGVNKYDTVRDLYLRKTGQAPVGEHQQTGILRFGHEAEPILARLLEDETGLRARRAGTYRSRGDERLIANVDRLTSDGGIAEFKTAGEWAEAGRLWKDGTIPGHAYIQAHHYHLTMGRTPIRFVVGIRNDDIDYNTLPDDAWQHDWFWDLALKDTMIVGPIEPDKEILDRIRTAIDQMDAAVQARDESLIPWPDSALVEDRYPIAIAGTEVVAQFGTTDLADRWLALDQEKKRLDSQMREIADVFKEQLQDQETLVDDQKRVLATWKNVTSNRLDQKALKSDHGELVDQYTVPSQSRRFTVVKPKS